MTGQGLFRVYFKECETVVSQITKNLEYAGMSVVRSFDLRSACAPLEDNICPHHGTAPCDCQLVVLLVYGPGLQYPISLILHSHRGKTELGWDDSPGMRPSAEWQAVLLQAIEGEAPIPHPSSERFRADRE